MQPLGISFQANQEIQRRGLEKEIHHEAILHRDAKSSHAMRNSEDSSFKANLVWSPFFTYHISFRSSRSQESNALNGMQFGAETRKLWPI